MPDLPPDRYQLWRVRDVVRRTETVIEDRNGQVHVLLSPDGDHIVTKYVRDRKGEVYGIMLPDGDIPWARAVERAQRGAAFL